MRILISGAGIAGPTLAYWLHQFGLKPTIVERASALRTGGYVIDFWGVGFDVAERMGLLPGIRRDGYVVREVRVVGRDGNRSAGFSVDSVARIANGRYISIPRGDLAALIYRKIEGSVHTIFNDSIAAIEQRQDCVQVRFDSGSTGDFDAVIGADGLHSRVREIVFGPERQFEQYLGYKVAAFEVAGYRPRDELVYLMHTEVGQQVGRFALRGHDCTLFFFIFADPCPATPDDVGAQKHLLRERFGKSGWECPQILDALDSINELYFDRVSQIRMGTAETSWSRGRVALVGDAAFCVSLLAGQGSAIAMAAAFILAGELYRAAGDYQSAFARYQGHLEAFVRRKQRSAMKFAGTFAPKSRFSMVVRNAIMNMLRVGWIADFVIGQDLGDHFTLPVYQRKDTRVEVRN
jgi:2-polyprenyl-6-methoxyphenol hydroxylase-like FAD-dependent oxidoreductase